MRKRFCLVRDGMWFGRALVTVAVATAVPLTAFGADRVVLCESFTSSA